MDCERGHGLQTPALGMDENERLATRLQPEASSTRIVGLGRPAHAARISAGSKPVQAAMSGMLLPPDHMRRIRTSAGSSLGTNGERDGSAPWAMVLTSRLSARS